IDTGLDIYHRAFATAPKNPAMTMQDIENVYDSLNCNAMTNGWMDAYEVYGGAKIPFMFDYADKDSDVNPEYSAVANNGGAHGTHVAGIIAGNEEGFFQGVAIDAQLAIFKVFSDYENGAYSTDIMAAVSDAIILGCDVVNLSLGRGCGFTTERDASLNFINNAYNLAGKTGMILSIATGNDRIDSSINNFTKNPDNGIVGSPASYKNGISVGSFDNTIGLYGLINGTKIMINSAVSGGLARYNFIDILKDKTESEFEFVCVGGAGKEIDYEKVDVNGKIAVIKRGEIPFEEKQAIAASKGAIGCIIHNTEAGTINAIIANQVIPTATIRLDQAKILTDIGSGKIFLSKEFTYLESSPFSSQGVLEDLTLGVDICGIGGNVYSTVNAVYDMEHNTNGYDYMSGTSMAAPNVAGVSSVLAGYLKTTYPDLTTAELKAMVNCVLMSSAKMAYDMDGNIITPRYQGAGIADINGAIATKAYLSVTGSDYAKMSLGHDVNKDGIYTLNFNVVNIGEVDASYYIDTIVATEKAVNGRMSGISYIFENAEKNYSVTNGNIDGNILTVQAGQTAKIKVIITLTQSDKAYMDENYVNGIYVEGFAQLKPVEQGVELSIPFVSFYGDWYNIPVFEPTYFEFMDNTAIPQNSFVDIKTSKLIGNLGEIGFYKAVGLGRYVFGADDIEVPKPSVDKIALGYKGELAFLTMTSLRNISELELSVEDIYGNTLYLGENLYSIPKVYYQDGRDIFLLDIEFGNVTAEYYRWANNQKLILRAKAKVNDVDVNQSIEFPIYIDYEAPTMNSVKLREENGRTYLDLNMYDNHYMQAIAMYTQGTDTEYKAISKDPVPVYEFKKGCANDMVIDVTKYMKGIVNNTFAINLIDYAGNERLYDIELGQKTNQNNPQKTTDDIELNRHKNEKFVTNSLLNMTDIIAIGDIRNAEIRNSLTQEELKEEFVVVDGVLVAYNGVGGDVTIPSDLGITEIGENAFYRNYDIINVVIPEGITTIGDMAFFEAYNVKTLKTPTTLTTLGRYALGCMSRLEALDFTGASLSSFGDGAITGNSTMKKLVIPKSNSTLSLSRCFAMMMELETLEIYADIDTILNCFLLNIKLKTVDFYGKVNNIVGESFLGCFELGIINFHQDVGNIDNYLQDFYGEVFDLSTHAFAYLDNLKTVNFYGNVEKLGSYAFNACKNLENVVFYKNVNIIEDYAFGTCPKLIDGFDISADNEYLIKDEYGVVYDKAKTKMYMTSEWDYDGSFVVPDTVLELAENQFGTASMEMIDIEFEYTASIKGEYRSSVTMFGSYTTSNKNLLKGVVLHSNITKLPDDTFRNCRNLSSVNIENITYFGRNCFYRTGMESMMLNKDTTFIGSGAFTGMHKLKEFDYPVAAFVDDNGYDSMFSDCDSLVEVVIPVGIPMGVAFFEGCDNLEKVTMLDSELTAIYPLFFYKCQKLTTVIGFENAQIVAYSAFTGCTSLKEINLPSVKNIGESAFEGCASLESIKYSEQLYSFDEGAFANCTSLKSIYFPANLGEINLASVLYNCKSLMEITVSEENNVYASVDGALYNKDITSLIKYPAAKLDEFYSVPETVKALNDGVFASSVWLKEIEMLGVEYIGMGAFEGCIALQKAIVRDLVAINAGAFINTSLNEINLSKVELIGGSAFANTKLTNVSLYNIQNVHLFAFENCELLETVTLYNTESFDFSSVFYGCFNIKNIILDESCKTFVYENDTLYNAEKTVLYHYYGNAETIELNEGLLKISINAFYGNNNIKNVTFSSTLKSIGDKAFYDCLNLKTLTFLSETAPALEGLYIEGAKYYQSNFVKHIEKMDVELELICNGNDTYRNLIWTTYFKTIIVK
ncbi:MAG: leucine-rich repeat protein, partial [Clostridia bacterium]